MGLSQAIVKNTDYESELKELLKVYYKLVREEGFFCCANCKNIDDSDCTAARGSDLTKWCLYHSYDQKTQLERKVDNNLKYQKRLEETEDKVFFRPNVICNKCGEQGHVYMVGTSGVFWCRKCNHLDRKY